MKVKLVVVALALVLAMMSYASADQAGALGKISAAQAAAADKKPAQAATDLSEAAKTIEQDTTGAGPVAEDMGKGMAAYLNERAAVLGRGAAPSEEGFDSITERVKNIYGLTIPGSKGDLAAAANYVKGLAGSATGDAKDKLSAAANALSDAAAGKGDKAKAFAQARVAANATALLLQANQLISEKKYKDAAPIMGNVGDYLSAETKIARDADAANKADVLREAAGIAKSSANDLMKGIDPGLDIKGETIPNIEKAIAMPASAAAPAAKESAKEAAEAKEMKAEKKAEAKAEKAEVKAEKAAEGTAPAAAAEVKESPKEANEKAEMKAEKKAEMKEEAKEKKAE